MITVKAKGFEEFVNDMNKAGDLFPTIMRKALTRSVTKIQREAKDNAEQSKDTGSLQRNIKRTVRGLRGEVVAGSPHAIFVEEGTRPHFPPVAPLEAWAARKLGSPGLGFVIARSIARKGTPAQPFMQPAVDDSIRDVERYFEIALDELVDVMAK